MDTLLGKGEADWRRIPLITNLRGLYVRVVERLPFAQPSLYPTPTVLPLLPGITHGPGHHGCFLAANP